MLLAAILALQVQSHHDGLTRHGHDGVENVASELPPVHQLDARNAHALLAYVRCPGGVAARGHGADVHDVDKSGAPGDATVLVVYGGKHVDVGLVDGRHIRIVQQEDVIRVDTVPVFEPLDDLLHREPGAGHVLTQGLARRQHVAVGRVEGRHIIVLLGGVDRSPHPFEGNPHLPGDLVQPVRQNLHGDGIDAAVALCSHDLLPMWSTMLRNSSISAWSFGFTTMVVTGVSMMAGPVMFAPGDRRPKS